MQAVASLAPLFAHGLYSLLTLGRGERCVCECHSISAADDRILAILREQLARCGPEHLGRAEVVLWWPVALAGFALGLLARDLVVCLYRRGVELFASAANGEVGPELPGRLEGALAVTPSRRR